MPVTLSLKTQQYIDPDANKIVSSLPVLHSEYSAPDEHIAFLRRFFRAHDTQTLMKIFRKLYMVECRRLSPLTRAVVSIAATVYGNIRGCGHNILVTELLQILSKPNFQALLYCHDKIASRDFSPQLSEDFGVQNGDDQTEHVTVIQFIKTSEPLGATLQYNDETGTLQIARIMIGGAADRSGLLHIGDEILEVAGKSVRDKTPDEVVQMLGKMTGSISMKIVSGTNRLVTLRESKMRVRAFFDYNPINDVLNPCPDAGLNFCRGDVLHIVSQDDPWWWQARKEGELSGKTGLIPARQLQERTEMMKRYHSDEDLRNCTGRSSRGTSPCRISPKIPRSRRIKKTMYQAQHSGGTPEIYRREYDIEDIPTYEEVELFQPTQDRFRPVVLIGPPGVGRNELKRRVMVYAPDTFEEVVPYTSRKRKQHEQDSREYHFVPREEMERGIINHKFVEFGEFKGNLYGTSYASIRSVIQSGKICLLTPHTQALKFLRCAEIKPFVIFIKPPPLEVLRMTRRQTRAMKTLEGGTTRLLTDEDFTDMLSIGARIEIKYAHFFDAILINDDIIKASKQLLAVINELQSKPQWVPLSWVR
ncbi:MAGUK p55 subfamily member 7-like isoform X2 [Mercenaria mercenaria]|uniref:MAGUK p55 subfamily member 7-like isoform X2 n=1 Tax=Mercenaria mercenaria TaxID=6596 RepID=UPI00234E65E0|nr:MAGUK p55 subfamily member 7-like isoform X2 [Mercenaria mercenaria]